MLESLPVVTGPLRAVRPMDQRMDNHNYALVILAGGDGVRLNSFTHKVLGHPVPKQFCPFFRGRTLLEQTMRRVSLLEPLAQTITVLKRAYESFYSPLLNGIANVTISGSSQVQRGQEQLVRKQVPEGQG